MLKLIAFLGLNASGYELGLKRAQSASDKFAKDVKSSVGDKLKEYLGYAAIVAAIGKVIEYASKITDLSDEIEIGTDALQQWEHALTKAGGKLEDATGFMEKLAQAREKARGGDAGTLEAFSKFGISRDDLKTKRLEGLAFQIGDAVKDGDAQKLIASLKEIGGKGAVKLVAAFKSGLSESFGEASVINDKTIAGLDALGDHFTGLWHEIRSGLASIIMFLAPLGVALETAFLDPFRALAAFLGARAGGASFKEAFAAAKAIYAESNKTISGLLNPKSYPNTTGGGPGNVTDEAALKKMQERAKLAKEIYDITQKNDLQNLSIEERIKKLTQDRLDLLKKGSVSGNLDHIKEAEEKRGDINNLLREQYKNANPNLNLNALQKVGAQILFKPQDPLKDAIINNTDATVANTNAMNTTQPGIGPNGGSDFEGFANDDVQY